MKKLVVMMIVVLSALSVVAAQASEQIDTQVPIADDAIAFVGADGSLNVWMADSYHDDVWNLGLMVNADKLAAATAAIANTWIAASDDGKVNIYKLVSDQYTIRYLDANGDYSQLVLNDDLSFASLTQYNVSEGIPYAN